MSRRCCTWEPAFTCLLLLNANWSCLACMMMHLWLGIGSSLQHKLPASCAQHRSICSAVTCLQPWPNPKPSAAGTTVAYTVLLASERCAHTGTCLQAMWADTDIGTCLSHKGSQHDLVPNHHRPGADLGHPTEPNRVPPAPPQAVCWCLRAHVLMGFRGHGRS